MDKWAFLWITDLHYELPQTNYSDDPKDIPENYNLALRDDTFRDFHSLLELDFASLAGLDAGKSLSFIAIGGDITSHGKDAGFKRFSDEAIRSLQRKVTRPEAICIIPGNHDVVWGLDPTSQGYFQNKFKSFVKLVDEHGMSSCYIPRGELRQDASEQHHDLTFDPPREGPLFVDPDAHVLVLNINSAIRCGELNRKMCLDIEKYAAKAGSPAVPKKASSSSPQPVNGRLVQLRDFDEDLWPYLIRDVAHVTQIQLRKLRDKLISKKAELGEDWHSYLRVALIHHHLAPFPGQHVEHKGYESMVDSAQVLELLTSFDFDIALTGHKHQPYQLPNRFNGKDIFILGGATVGGFTTGESFRGFQLVEFESSPVGRKVDVRNVECKFARGDMQDAVEGARRHSLASHVPVERIMSRAAARVGYSYRDMVSITRISEDGDGRRVVECDDLVIKKPCFRSSGHPIELPPTSGYLDQFHATGKGFHVFPKSKIPDDQSAKAAKIELRFHPEIGVGQPSSYRYEWYAVNAFALDKLQFARKYGTADLPLRDIEYTHFIPDDPIERLTLIVQFPKGLVLPYPPTLRIARVDPANSDSRYWEIDREATQSLDNSRALRYYETLNLAALRVRVPKRGLSYGIQWTLPDAPEHVGSNRLAKVVRSLESSQDEALRRVYRVLQGSRETLFSGWDKDLDGTLMVFSMDDTVGKLKALAAGYASASPSEEAIQRLSRDVELLYGDGITGRAFKVNRIRVYVDPSTSLNHQIPSESKSKFEPNFYKPVPGTLSHKSLVAFPIHLPVPDKSFEDDPSIYERLEPYGVLNIGSQSDDCPMGELLLAKRAPELLYFQHFANKMLADPTSG